MIIFVTCKTASHCVHVKGLVALQDPWVRALPTYCRWWNPHGMKVGTSCTKSMRGRSQLSLYSIATTSVIKAQIAPLFLHASSFCYTHSALYMFYAWRKSHKVLVPEWTFFHNWVLSCFPVCKFPFPWKIYKYQQDYPLTFRWVLIFISF